MTAIFNVYGRDIWLCMYLETNLLFGGFAEDPVRCFEAHAEGVIRGTAWASNATQAAVLEKVRDRDLLSSFETALATD